MIKVLARPTNNAE